MEIIIAFTGCKVKIIKYYKHFILKQKAIHYHEHEKIKELLLSFMGIIEPIIISKKTIYYFISH